MGSHHPAGGGEADFGAVDVGRESGAGGFDDLRAERFGGVLEGEADGAEAGDVGDELAFGHGACYVNGLDVDAVPTAGGQDASHVVWICEGELAGRAGLARGEAGQERRGGGWRRHRWSRRRT